jgi:glycosyltransferase involved in cell wall biosynthesis
LENSFIESCYPKVTVCIPLYNGYKFISEAIASIESQTYLDLEILFSDDGSSDGTLEIVQCFATRSRHRVRILEHEQLGLVQNWNYCLREAQGKYVKFLFQDDLLDPDCVSELLKLAEEDDEIGLVFSKRRILLGDGSMEPDQDWKQKNWFLFDLYRHWSRIERIQSGADLLNDPKFLQEPLNKIGEPTTVLLRKSALEEVGFFDESLRQAVDSEMWFRILTKYKCGFVDKYLSTYRVHDRQASQDNVDAGIIQDDYCAVMAKIATHPAFGLLPEKQRCLAWIKAWQMNPRNTGVSSIFLLRTLGSGILVNPVSRTLFFSEVKKWMGQFFYLGLLGRIFSDLKWWARNWPKRLFGK